MSHVVERPSKLSAIRTRQDVRLGCVPDQKDHRDKHYPTDKDITCPPTVDLRGQLPDCYDQGNLGSCTANAIAGGLQFVQQKQGQQLVMPSRLFIYYNERDMEGTTGTDAGAQIRDGIKSVVKLGYCSEDEWPYDISQFATRPPDGCYADAQQEQVTIYYRVSVRQQAMVHCLASGFPFVFGISVYESFMDAPNGDVPMPQPDEKLLGGHAMLCVGYDQSSRRFLFRNSWGTGWGDNGYGTIPFEYLASVEYGGDYWTIRAEEIP